MRFNEPRVDLRPSLPTPAREILLVEDDEALSFLVAMLLKNAGYLIHSAGTKREALYEISRRIPDCLILDVSLPDGNGLDLLRLVRQLPETRTLPVILFTAMATPEDKEKGRSLGANGYIVKPFEHAHLLAEIDRVTRGGMA
jgi:DNA-binding response OmpR family regulator